MYEMSKSNQLDFGPGMGNNGKDFRVLTSTADITQSYDVLVFTDSKGSSISEQGEQCWTDMLISQLIEKGMSCLFVSRPKELTTFFTLINFLNNNLLSFRYLITNVGFVDFTPKKEEFMTDILSQAPSENIRSGLSYQVLSSYQLSSGEDASLYTFEYGDIEKVIAEELTKRFEYTLLVGTMEFSPAIAIQRKRPPEFFTQLNKTNEFIFKIAQASHKLHFVQPLKYPFSNNGDNMSYDAVHFTPSGHTAMYQILSPVVGNYICRRMP